MNFCKDCKHRKRDPILFFASEFWRCHRPNAYGSSTCSLTGAKKLAYCTVERGDYSTLPVCGPEGKFFELKTKDYDLRSRITRIYQSKS